MSAPKDLYQIIYRDNRYRVKSLNCTLETLARVVEMLVASGATNLETHKIEKETCR